MATHKNFKINRNKHSSGILARDVKIGDVFEREGSLHMLANPCQITANMGSHVLICSLNTGSVWFVKDTETFTLVENCEISYDVSVAK